jgi:acetylornithine deacetylase/succinyl-diaminopimelate desuccinylase-like protein
MNFNQTSARCGLVLPLLLVISSLLWGEEKPAELSPSAQRMLEDVKTLASDEWEGRGIGTQGLQKAASYIADEFRKAGLNVTSAGGDPYQEFEITDRARLGSPNLLTLHGPDGKTIDLKYDQDFRTCSFGSTGKFSAPVVFAGYGIDAEDIQYNDFADIDVQGKVVIVMRRNPMQGNPHGPFAVAHGISRHAALTTKVSQAFTRGAVAILFVNDPLSGRTAGEELGEQVHKARQQLLEAAENVVSKEGQTESNLNQLRQAINHVKEAQRIDAEHNPDPLMEFGHGGTRSGESLPCFQITQKICDEILLASAGNSLAEIESQIDESGKPMSKPLKGWTISGEASVETVKVPVSNVIGVLEGSGPLRQETIVIGAHFDHLGRGEEGSLAAGSKEIHNGADDNASGTAGLLELARRLGQRPSLPRRVVFIAFTGEERGLLGSKEYVDQPLFPIDQTIAMFNMDMIGRMEDDKLIVFGTGTSSTWDKLVDTAAGHQHFTITKKPEGAGPSDHTSFYNKDIPVLHLFTGTHSDYHRPSDDWEKIDARDMARIIDFLEEIIVATADAPARPDFIKVQGTASLERSGNRPYFGSIPDFGKEAKGYAIQGVSPGSPADKGGLKGGDVIIKLGDRRIGGLDDFDLALRKFAPGEQVEVVVLRDGKEVPLQVTLSTPRG